MGTGKVTGCVLCTVCVSMHRVGEHQNNNPHIYEITVKYERAVLTAEIDTSDEGGGLQTLHTQIAELLEVDVDSLRLVHRARVLSRHGCSRMLFRGDTVLALGPQHKAVVEGAPDSRELSEMADSSPAVAAAA